MKTNSVTICALKATKILNVKLSDLIDVIAEQVHQVPVISYLILVRTVFYLIFLSCFIWFMTIFTPPL